MSERTGTQISKGCRALNDTIRDLVVDVRCAERDGLAEYATLCRQDIQRLWARRRQSQPRGK